MITPVVPKVTVGVAEAPLPPLVGVNTIVGTEVKLEPPLIILMDVTAFPVNTALATKPAPPPPVTETVGGVKYPLPPTNEVYPVITPALPPPDSVTVGNLLYPIPLFVITNVFKTPPVCDMVAEAFIPTSPCAGVITIVGAPV